MVSVVLALSIFLVTSSPWACEQQNLEATWLVVACNADEIGDHCVEYGDLTVGAGGSISGTYVDCSGVSSEIIGRQLSLSPDCVIEGYIETSNGTVYIDSGGIMGEELCLLRGAEE